MERLASRSEATILPILHILSERSDDPAYPVTLSKLTISRNGREEDYVPFLKNKAAANNNEIPTISLSPASE